MHTFIRNYMKVRINNSEMHTENQWACLSLHSYFHSEGSAIVFIMLIFS